MPLLSGNKNRNKSFFDLANKVLVGGVNSPVRSFSAVGGTPRFISRGKGAYIWDVDAKRYLDYVISWGAMFLGHAHNAAVEAVSRQVKSGLGYGAPTSLETEMAITIREAFPSMERIRLVSSGTEAVMSAIRLARGYTGRDLIVKFAGGYHGHSDSLLVSAGSGLATMGRPFSLGVPKNLAAATVVMPYNDLGAIGRFFKKSGSKVACVVVEPVAGNMGTVKPVAGFLELLSEVTAKSGALLIFDEVITGFRFCFGGVQAIYKIKPDLTCLGKIIGGGLPVGAFGGRRDIMKMLAPEGAVYQAGTLSGNPVAVACGLATLKTIKRLDPYKDMERKTSRLAQEIISAARAKGVDCQVNHAGSMFTVFFTSKPVQDYVSAKLSDTKRYARFFHQLLAQGIYFPPSQFEAAFLSCAHTDADIVKTITAIKEAL